jgi:uncharacterized protein YdhG (YjbR/CyaY superfamily)
VNPASFRRLALAMPGAAEVGHMGHPDFRVGGKIFATLGYPDGGWGMVKLTPDQQEAFVSAHPGAFAPVKGGWGVRGATLVRLAGARVPAVRTALSVAWRNVAPPGLAGRVMVRVEEGGRGTIDEYLASLRPDQRAALQRVRRAVRAAAPGAEEGWSYGLPAFRLDGKPIAGFAAHAGHCAYYPMSGAIVAAHAALLAPYETSKGAVRFTPDSVLPAALIRKLVRARVAEVVR